MKMVRSNSSLHVLLFFIQVLLLTYIKRFSLSCFLYYPGEVILRKRNNGYWGVSFAIENRTIKKESGKIRKNNNNDDAGQDMTFTLDCSDSINVVSGPLGLITKTSGSGDIQQQQKLIRTVVVKPGEIKIVHHLVPKTQGPWSWKYKATWDFI
jgi:hypothetical protein